MTYARRLPGRHCGTERKLLFGHQVNEQTEAAADVTVPPVQFGSFKVLDSICPNFHLLTERTRAALPVWTKRYPWHHHLRAGVGFASFCRLFANKVNGGGAGSSRTRIWDI